MSEFKTYRTKFRVYYEDTDCTRHVNFLSFTRFCERARSDFIREIFHFDQQRYIEELSRGFVISTMDGKVLAQAALNDELTVSCALSQIRSARIKIYQEIRNGQDQLLYVQMCSLAYIDLQKGAPEAMPKDLLDDFTAYLIPKDVELAI